MAKLTTAKKLELLEKAQKLAQIMRGNGIRQITCETSQFFNHAGVSHNAKPAIVTFNDDDTCPYRLQQEQFKEALSGKDEIAKKLLPFLNMGVCRQLAQYIPRSGKLLMPLHVSKIETTHIVNRTDELLPSKRVETKFKFILIS